MSLLGLFPQMEKLSMWCMRTQLMPSRASRAASRSACWWVGKHPSKQMFVAQNRTGPASFLRCPSSARMKPWTPAGGSSQADTFVAFAGES